VELMVGVDKGVKMRGYERKSVLRRSLARRLPLALLRAPKRGFAVPVGEWFRDQGFARYAAELVAPGGLGLAAGPLREVLARNERGETAFGNLLWILVVLDRFCRRSESGVAEPAAPARRV
jgi:asparagine synthase (glutamine-hydrolysing)